MSGKADFNRRKGCKSQQSTRVLRIEALEDRSLLSALPVANYPDLNTMFSELPISEDANYIDVTELTAENLRNAIQQAAQTTKDDVVVVHTTETENTIALNGSALIFDIDSDLYGSITLVGYGDTMLTLSNTQENVVMVYSGEVYFGGISFLAQQYQGDSFQTSNLVVVSEGATVNYSRTMNGVEDMTRPACSLFTLDSDPYPDSESTTGSKAATSTQTYTMLDVQVSGKTRAFIAGLTSEAVTKIKNWSYTGYITSSFIDAEKCEYNNDFEADDYLCWAAGASNVLWYTGWANPNLKDDNGKPFKSEDDVFTYFINHFENNGSDSYYAYEWFISGNYTADPDWAQPWPSNPGGNYYPDINVYDVIGISGYITLTGQKSTVLQRLNDLTSKLRDGYGINLGIFHNSGGGHEITAWGYVYDSSKKNTDTGYYKKLLITDSDDDGWNTSIPSATSAPNKLHSITMTWNGSRYNLSDRFAGYYLSDYVYLPQAEKYISSQVLDVPTLKVEVTGSNSVSVTVGKVANASKYTVVYTNTVNFVNSKSKDVEPNTPTTIGNLNANTTYRFYVKAIGQGNYTDSPNSDIITVKTTPDKLATPTLKVWTLDSYENPLVFIQVGEVANATNYILEYSTDSNFTNAQTMDYSGGTSHYTLSELNLKANTKYYFRVRATSSGNFNDSNYCDVQTLTTPAKHLSTPSLSIVSTNSNSISVKVGTVANASGYKLQYSTSKNFSTLAGEEDNVPAGVAITIDSLKANTLYYFRVKAIGTGEYGDSEYTSSPIFATTNKQKLDAPSLEAVSTTSDTITIMVGEVPNATDYTVQFSTSKTFLVPFSMNVVPGINVIDHFVHPNTTYFLRVMAIGNTEYDNSEYSTPPVTATTNKIPLETPTLTGSASGTNSAYIVIGDVNHASKYTLQIADNKDFRNAESKEIFSAGGYSISGLSNTKTYYFRAIAIGSGNYSDSASSDTVVIDPSGFNNNDFSTIRSFLETTDTSGKKNGTKINPSYNPNDPSTWTGVTAEDVNGVLRITRISWNGKQLTGTLDVSQCTALTSLSCSNNKLTGLNVSGCSALTSLSCNNNQLSTLSISGCTALSTLYCYSNQFVTLDVSNHIALTSLYCNSNKLTSLNVSGCTGLNTLVCYSNELPALNVSGCTALNNLNCHSNKLSVLNLNNNKALNTLYCYSNSLKTLDMSSNSTLTYLDCKDNELALLNVSQNAALTYLYCDNNQLPSLNILHNIALKTLVCDNNQITELDASQNTALTWLSCNYNKLVTLSVATCTELDLLECMNNQLTKLDVSHNTALTKLDCNSNRLDVLDVSQCTALVSLDCGSNRLRTLDVRNLPSLLVLNCQANFLTEVNVTNNLLLSDLSCWGNQLSELNVSRNCALSLLDCDNNKLTVLDLSRNPELWSLSCSYNKLTNLDISECPKLEFLFCGNSGLECITLCSEAESTTIYLSSVRILGGNNSFWTFRDANGYTLEQNVTSYEYRADNNISLPMTATLGTNIQTIRLVRATRTPLASPTVNVTATGSDSVSVSVNSVSNAAGYILQYSPDEYFGYDLHTMSATTSSRTISGLDANTTYYFRAMAIGTGNYRNSNYGTVKSVDTQRIKLDSPTLNIVNTDSNSVLIKVNEQENASGYRIQSSTNSNFSGANTINFGSANSTLTLSGLNSNTTYYVRAMALGAGDYTDSNYSSPIIITTPKPKLGTPKLIVSSTGSNSVSVFVGEINYASGYTLEYSTSSDFSNVTSQRISAGNTNINGLRADTTYYFRVSSNGSTNYNSSNYGTVAVCTEASPVNVTATANKLAIQFEANVNEQFTVVLKGRDAATGKETLTVKNVKAAAKNIQGGNFTYNFSGKVNYNYEVFVVNGKYTTKQIQAYGGTIPEYILVGSGSVTTLAPFTLVASPGKATAHSITFQQKNGQPIESLDNLTFSAKFDGDRAASVYTVNGDKLVCGNRSYGIELNENGSITISGLKLNTKQTFQVSRSSENAVSAYSSNLSIATTKEQKAAPEEVEAWLGYNQNGMLTGNVTVGWSGEANSTYTISYSYTGAKGKRVTKNATTKATVNMYGYGEFTVSKLLSNTKYTFSVSANKTKDYDASVFVAAEDDVITPTTIPVPTLKKVSVTSSSVTFQVTNWNKMETALQERWSNNGSGGVFYVMETGGKVGRDDAIAWFSYDFDARGNLRWQFADGLYNGTMEISTVNKKNIATITISGLQANKDYSFQTIAYNEVQNTNINMVVPATSKAFKIKTAK
ncbi:MAG: hypothetical protein IJQ31_16445 [Thermoguttaceae bacterium]|nr:hypothetical protein [Thermoguttaceae bacterium]